MESRLVRRSRYWNLLRQATAASAVAFVVVAMAVAQVQAPAWAGGVFDPVECDSNPLAPECVIDVITVGAAGQSNGSGVARCRDFMGDVAPCFIQKYGWNGGDGCYYKAAAPTFVDAFPLDAPQAWYEGWCGSVASGLSFVTRMRIFTSPPGQALLVAEAVKLLQLPAPAIHLNPAPPAAQLVFVPTWLWVDASSWESRTATASVPGMSVTATATPTSLTWSMGDGATVTCHGAGTPWQPGGDPMAESPDCGHKFTHPSGEGAFVVRATIGWNVSWSGGGATGVEPALASTTSADVKVAESPTVVTRGGV